MYKFHLIYTRWATLSSRKIFRAIYTFLNAIKQNVITSRYLRAYKALKQSQYCLAPGFWVYPEFIPGCTYTALLPGSVCLLALEFTPNVSYLVFLLGAGGRGLPAPHLLSANSRLISAGSFLRKQESRIVEFWFVILLFTFWLLIF